MGQLKHKGYTGSVEFSDEDNCTFGKVQGLHGTLISYEDTTINKLRSDFESAIDEYLANCESRGIAPAKPYSGKLVLRMPSELHGRVAAAAMAAGTTINDFINTALSNEMERNTVIG